MEKSPVYIFTPVESNLKSVSSKERKDQLLQYNLDKNLKIEKFRFTGGVPKTASDFDKLVIDLFASPICLKVMDVSGAQVTTSAFETQQLKLTVTNMGFFDKLEDSDVVGPGGIIKGCFDETFEGITVGDKLREMLLNESSDQADLFNPDEQSEFIFQLFKILAVGGALCQTDSNISRYFDLTKDLYKELVTIYKDSKTDTVQFSGRVYKIISAPGFELFPSGNSGSSLNSLILLVDPLKKVVTVVKNSFKSFW